jgi:hypothetical protein
VLARDVCNCNLGSGYNTIIYLQFCIVMKLGLSHIKGKTQTENISEQVVQKNIITSSSDYRRGLHW